MKLTSSILLLLLVVGSARATILTVPDPYLTIQSAFEASSEGDTILVSPGTWDGSIVFPEHDVILASQFLLNGDPATVALTIIEPEGPLAQATVTFNAGQTLATQLVGFTIQDGWVGIKCEGASPTIRDNRIRDNYRDEWGPTYGCGIELIESSAHILRNRIDHNVSIVEEFGGHGAGIGCFHSGPTIEENIIEYNVAMRGPMGGVYGAGIGMLESWGLITGNTLRHNEAIGTSGGGIALSASFPHIENNLIENNSAWGGSGLFVAYSSNPVIESTVIRWNRRDGEDWALWSGKGGGISVENANPQLGTEQHPISVYDNLVPFASDILLSGTDGMTIWVDTLTVIDPDRRFVYLEDATLHVQSGRHPILSDTHELYVSPEGSDDNDGSSANEPLQSLYSASVRLPLATDTRRIIHLMPGTYNSQQNNQLYPVSLPGKVTLAGSGEVILEGGGEDIVYCDSVEAVRIEGIRLTSAKQALTNVAAEVDLSNIEVDSTDVAISSRSSHLNIVNSWFSRNRELEFSSSYVQCRYNETTSIRGCTFSDMDVPALVIWGRESLVSQCLFEGLTENAIQLQYADSFRLANSIFVGNSGSATGAVVVKSSDNGRIENCTFVSNESRGGAGGALWIRYQSTVDVLNNIFWLNRAATSGDQISDGDGGVTVTYSLVEGGYEGIGNIDTDPLFASEYDFYLDPDSPAIDAGNPDQQYNDSEDPEDPGFALWPAQGGLRNDMGVFGGATPYARYVIDDLPPAERDPALQHRFQLDPVYPNPFNSTTLIHFTLPEAGQVRVTVFDVLGRKVAVVADERMTAGSKTLKLEGRSLPSGVYFLQVTTPYQARSTKLVLLK